MDRKWLLEDLICGNQTVSISQLLNWLLGLQIYSRYQRSDNKKAGSFGSAFLLLWVVISAIYLQSQKPVQKL